MLAVNFVGGLAAVPAFPFAIGFVMRSAAGAPQDRRSLSTGCAKLSWHRRGSALTRTAAPSTLSL